MKRYLLYPVIILVIVKLLFMFPVIDALEFMAQDSLFRLRGTRPVSGDIVIVAVDDATFSALDIRWPFPRDMHAKLIDNLNAAGVKQIVFDVEFTESSSLMADSILAATAAKHQNVIFAGKVLQAKSIHEPSQIITPIQPVMEQNLSWGIVNMSSDSDNKIRKYTLFDWFDKIPLYSIGVASLGNKRVYQPDWDQHINLADGHLQVAGLSLPMYKANKALINYYGGAGTFQTLSFASVVDDSTQSMPGYQGFELDEFYDIRESGILKGKTVLVGATVDELHDNFPTPMGGEWTPGVEIHANFLEMANRGDFLSEVNTWLFFGIELLLLLLLWMAYRHLKPVLGVALMLLLILAQYALAWFLFSRMNLLVPIVQSALVIAFVYIISLISHYLDTMKEKRFIRSAFQQYLAPELVSELLKNPKNLSYGGQLQEITVLFSDIRSFTTYSEKHTPAETVNILKEYLTEMVKIITANQGILDKFVGDEVMALFGTPLPTPEHALNACKVALQMRDKMTEMQDKWKAEGKEGFEIGIGINTGQAVVGNLGSEQIFDYTAIGDTINLGARLESINKEYETAKHIIISEFTLEQVKDKVQVKYLDEVKVKGKNNAVKIYELIGLV